MRHWLRVTATAFAIVATLGALTVVSGVIPIEASAGHFAITRWLLVFAKKRSIATYSMGADPQPPPDPALVLKGAGHYEAGCRPCHGAPDLPRVPRVPHAMLPAPPSLAVVVPQYEPEELFHIVKHGIKFTGMPAWPSQVRDDEVSAVVAFLMTLPGLDGARYRCLVHGEGDATSTESSSAAAASAAEPLDVLVGAERAPRAVVASCGRCHGLDGLGRGNAAFPALAGQDERYLVASLEAFAADRRQSGIMQPAAAALPAEEMRELAAYYSGLPARRARGTPTAGALGQDGSGATAARREAIARGREIAERGVPDRRIPSCSDCHGPAPVTGDATPTLAGQHADYLVLQLSLLHDRRRGGTERVHLMDEVAPRLTPEQMHDVAAYYESLEP